MNSGGPATEIRAKALPGASRQARDEGLMDSRTEWFISSVQQARQFRAVLVGERVARTDGVEHLDHDLAHLFGC